MAINSLKVRNSLGLTPTSIPTSPTNGDIYYDSGSNTFQFYQNGTFITYSTGTGFNGRAGSQSVSSSSTSQAITFSSTLGTTSYAISAIFVNTTDTNPQFEPIVITSQSATGFTAKWNVPTATANYSIQYTAILNV